jgi:broad specificity phosphatase PhoE
MPAAPVTYVRHAMPAPVEGAHPTDWRLDDRARSDAARMAERLEVGSRMGRLVTSTEPKALETAAAVGERWGVPVEPDDRLREAVRPWIGAGYRAVVHRYLRGELPEGWEPHEDVAGRVSAVVREACAASEDRPIVVVSHGLALALHLGERLGAGFDREQFWSSLSFPDAWTLDPTGMLHRAGAHVDAG